MNKSKERNSVKNWGEREGTMIWLESFAVCSTTITWGQRDGGRLREDWFVHVYRLDWKGRLEAVGSCSSPGERR